MQSSPKPLETDLKPAGVPETDPVSEVGAPGGSPPGIAHASPARALQERLVRELVQSGRPWLWHSAGLVLTTVLALWVAGLMLSAGV